MKFVFVFALIGIFAATVNADQCANPYNGWYYSYLSVWGSWSSCDHTCGGGYRVRTRTCNYYRNGGLYLRHNVESDKRPCNEICFNNGIYRDGKCQCVAGVKGNCCEVKPICKPICENNGTCIADDICQCASGFYGNRCEIGGNFNEFLLPKLHPTLPVDDLYKNLSWYDSPSYNSDNEACFVKIHIQDAPYDTIITASSTDLNRTNIPFGNFTAAPIDSSAAMNGSSRFACLQVRCPGTFTTGEEFEVLVNVSVQTQYKRCQIRGHGHHLIIFNVSSSRTGSDSLNVILENGNNYGPAYGIYINTGYLDKAVYLSKTTCYSGYSYDFNRLNPTTGVLAEYQCS